MKIFGIGLPRTGTTSVSIAMLMLGYKVAHTCFRDHIYERADAILDTPIWVDYQSLDQRFPNSKFILTGRDPEKWYTSLTNRILYYMEWMHKNNGGDNPTDYRCYKAIFGDLGDLSKERLIGCYQNHRAEAERYFSTRPGDLLILDLDKTANPWEMLCPFLGKTIPEEAFPVTNQGKIVGDWNKVRHTNVVSQHAAMPEDTVKWMEAQLARGVSVRSLCDHMIKNRYHIHLIQEVLGDRFPDKEPKFYEMPTQA